MIYGHGIKIATSFWRVVGFWQFDWDENLSIALQMDAYLSLKRFRNQNLFEDNL